LTIQIVIIIYFVVLVALWGNGYQLHKKAREIKGKLGISKVQKEI